MEDNSKITIQAWYKVSLVNFLGSRLEPTHKDTTLGNFVAVDAGVASSKWRRGSSYPLPEEGDLVQTERLKTGVD